MEELFQFLKQKKVLKEGDNYTYNNCIKYLKGNKFKKIWIREFCDVRGLSWGWGVQYEKFKQKGVPTEEQVDCGGYYQLYYHGVVGTSNITYIYQNPKFYRLVSFLNAFEIKICTEED